MPRISRLRRPISSPECSDVEVASRAAAAAPDPAVSANEDGARKGGLEAEGSRESSAEEGARKSGLSPASAVHEDVAREGSLVASDFSDLRSRFPYVAKRSSPAGQLARQLTGIPG